MNALEAINMFVEISGRHDMLTDANVPTAKAWFLANSAQRWLDRELGQPKEDAWLTKTVVAGQTIIDFTQCRYVKGVYEYNATTGTLTPLQWQPARHDHESTSLHWPYKAIEIAESTSDRTIRVLATWYSPRLEITTVTIPGSAPEIPADAIEIDTAEKLALISIDPLYPPDGYYVQTADINLTGLDWVPINVFTGTYDGLDHQITNLNSGMYLNASGLFRTNNGTIRNLRVSGTISQAALYAGILCADNYGIISECGVSGTITLTGGSYRAGGLVGKNWGSITDCYADVAVTAYSAAGLCSYNRGMVSYCYSVGAVTGENRTGGLVGENAIDGAVENSYYDSDESGCTDDDGRGEPKTTEDMQDASTYDGWDFNDIWEVLGDEYPSFITGSYPPVTVEVIANSFWTMEHPDVLIRAMQMQAEIDMRNTQGMNDFAVPLANDVRRIYQDLIAEEMAGTTEQWRMD